MRLHSAICFQFMRALSVKSRYKCSSLSSRSALKSWSRRPKARIGSEVNTKLKLAKKRPSYNGCGPPKSSKEHVRSFGLFFQKCFSISAITCAE